MVIQKAWKKHKRQLHKLMDVKKQHKAVTTIQVCIHSHVCKSIIMHYYVYLMTCRPLFGHLWFNASTFACDMLYWLCRRDGSVVRSPRGRGSNILRYCKLLESFKRQQELGLLPEPKKSMLRSRFKLLWGVTWCESSIYVRDVLHTFCNDAGEGILTRRQEREQLQLFRHALKVIELPWSTELFS